MGTKKIIEIVKQYSDKLKSENYYFFSIYLFGSQAKGVATQWSDIDIAVVSEKLNRNSEKNRLLLWNFRRDIDLRIEPHGFTRKEFENLNDPMVYEIRTTGIKVV